ncbi:MAG: signal recognition particle-docking protein FtsY [Chloroflexi bacterium]|nr:signal recognition particle-docking protein FtsY [Chloroflexota bacterium]
MFSLFKRKTEQAVKRSKETWFSKITSLFDRPTIDKQSWEELEELLIAADAGVDTAAKLIQRVKDRVGKERIGDTQQVRAALMQEMALMLKVDGKEPTAAASPRVILVVGVNGSGKTTTIAKLGYGYGKEGKVILAAADTFRAAAIEQLKWWGERIGAEVIAHQPGADPGAVVFDALQAAKTRGAQTVIVDTAGRLHTKFNLMEELKKIKRVVQRVDPSAPHEILLVLDATTGQNGLIQAKYFTETVGVNGIVLTKLDGTAKGGIVLAICDQLKIPVRFIGTGETLDDLAPFDPQTFVEAIMS